MQQFIADFHFLRPEWLWLLLLPLLLYRLYFKGLQNVSSWEGVCDPNLLDYLLIDTAAQFGNYCAERFYRGGYCRGRPELEEKRNA